MIAGLDTPVAAAQAHQLRWGSFGGPEAGSKQTGVVAAFAGFLFRDDRSQGQHLGGKGEVDLLRSDGGDPHLSVLDAAVVAAVGEKRGARPAAACSADASTFEQLPLSWIR